MGETTKKRFKEHITNLGTVAYERVFNMRTTLGDIRKIYNQKNSRAYRIILGVLAVSTVVGVLLDVFTPFQHVFLVLRCFAALGVGVPVFILGYSGTLWLHYKRVASADPATPWVPLRLRPVFSYRNRMSLFIIVAAICVVYATGVMNKDWSYSFMFGVVFAIIYGMFTFTRKTADEAARTQLGVAANPEEYDVIAKTREAVQKRHKQQKLKKQQKQVARVRRTRGKAKAEELQARFDAENQAYDEQEAKSNPDVAFDEIVAELENEFDDTPPQNNE